VYLSATLLMLILRWVWTKKGAFIFRSPLPEVVERTFRRLGWEPPRWMMNLAEQREMQPVERLFSRTAWMIKLFGEQTNTASTPAEQTARLTQLVPETTLPASILLDEFQRSIYGPYPADLPRARQASSQLWRIVLTQRVKRLFNRR
jgi:hypothetical protein